VTALTVRIVIDLQGYQSPTSRDRGIGRFSMALAQAMVHESAGKHDVWLALNGCFADTIGEIRDRFRELMPPERIVTFQLPSQPTRYTGGWRNRAAEAIRERFLANLAPDIVHVSSLFEGQNTQAATTIGSIPNAVTLYDLIPLTHKDEYLAAADVRWWYFRKLEQLRRAKLWLAISEHTRKEAVTRLSLSPDRVINISAAAGDRFVPLTITETRKRELRERYGLVRPFLMYTGGIDFRKNAKNLIAAFAMLPGRHYYQLAIVCSANDEARQMFTAHADKVGLDPADMVITGFVPESDLVALYNICHLFVFPSLDEGFGLPVLEAMACGAPVIGSNASSVPEVIGWNDALFDPKHPPAIAAAMARVLADEGFRQRLRDHGLHRVALFSWQESARRALAAFDQVETSMTTRTHSDAATGQIAELIAAREAADGEVNTLRDQLACLKAQFETTQAQFETTQAQFETTQAKFETTQAQFETARQAASNREQELLQAVRHWQTLSERRALELQSIFASRSWRLTKPVRWFGDLIQRRKSLRPDAK
jgi:glycosyltransferase involved in cell wall biosynthesis